MTMHVDGHTFKEFRAVRPRMLAATRQLGCAVHSEQVRPRMLAATGVDRDARLFRAFEAVLEVLPVSRRFTGVDVQSGVAASSSDFEALYDLSRLAYQGEVESPRQLEMWLGETEGNDEVG